MCTVGARSDGSGIPQAKLRNRKRIKKIYIVSITKFTVLFVAALTTMKPGTPAPPVVAGKNQQHLAPITAYAPRGQLPRDGFAQNLPEPAA
jgi:hypothetical protein